MGSNLLLLDRHFNELFHLGNDVVPGELAPALPARVGVVLLSLQTPNILDVAEHVVHEAASASRVAYLTLTLVDVDKNKKQRANEGNMWKMRGKTSGAVAHGDLEQNGRRHANNSNISPSGLPFQ